MPLRARLVLPAAVAAALLVSLLMPSLAPKASPKTESPVGSHASAVWTVDYAQSRPGLREDYLQYLELNWVRARRQAIRDGVVRSYRILVPPEAAQGDWDVMMITEYADSTAYADREAYFAALFAQPNWGPRLIEGRSSRDLADLLPQQPPLRPVTRGYSTTP